jgi:hypothetical protein
LRSYSLKRLDAKFAAAFFEWAELIDSYKGYLEEGTLDYVVETIIPETLVREIAFIIRWQTATLKNS